jgi:hypothetical protein
MMMWHITCCMYLMSSGRSMDFIIKLFLLLFKMIMKQVGVQCNNIVLWSFSLLREFPILKFIDGYLQWSSRILLSASMLLEWFACFLEGQKSILKYARTSVLHIAVTNQTFSTSTCILWQNSWERGSLCFNTLLIVQILLRTISVSLDHWRRQWEVRSLNKIRSMFVISCRGFKRRVYSKVYKACTVMRNVCGMGGWLCKIEVPKSLQHEYKTDNKISSDIYCTLLVQALLLFIICIGK